MTWKPEVDGIEERRRLALALGGEGAVARQHTLGRMTIRERIRELVDPESFNEQGPIAGHSEVDEDGKLQSFTPGNYVLGLGQIGGRPCAVGGEDFTQRGGSPTPAGLRKSVYAEDLACRYRIPLVRFLEGGGGSVVGAQRSKQPSGGDPVYARHRFASIAEAMATAPVVSAAVGPVAGLPAARLAASHFSLLVRETAQVMVAGPAIVERALGEKLTKEQLGGANVHATSGVIDNLVESEAEACEQIRRFLAFLPTNVWERAPRMVSNDDPARCDESLLTAVPRDRRRSYDMRGIIRSVFDRDSFFEIGAAYGPSQIVGLARLNGHSVGVLASDPQFHAGSMTAAGAQKYRRFIDMCDTFHLPIISLVDEPGFMIGRTAEEEATIRHGTALLFAVMQATVPWASVIVRKTYGVAAAAHFAPDAFVVSWPSAEAGALPVEGGVAVAFRREIEAAADPDSKRRELEELLAAGRSPFPRAESFGVHDLIDPRKTRPVLGEWLEWVQPLLRQHIGPKRYAIRP